MNICILWRRKIPANSISWSIENPGLDIKETSISFAVLESRNEISGDNLLAEHVATL